SPVQITGVFDHALKFDGTQSAAVNDTPSLDISELITMAAWIKPEQQTTQYLVRKTQQGASNGYELSLANSGKIFVRFNRNTVAASTRLDSQIDYPFDGKTWMHVAVTYDGTVLRIYINGIENNSLNSSGLIGLNNLPVTLG